MGKSYKDRPDKWNDGYNKNKNNKKKRGSKSHESFEDDNWRRRLTNDGWDQ